MYMYQACLLYIIYNNTCTYIIYTLTKHTYIIPTYTYTPLPFPFPSPPYLQQVVTRKFIRFLEDSMKTDRPKYDEFFLEFQYFIKEGQNYDPLCVNMFASSIV